MIDEKEAIELFILMIDWNMLLNLNRRTKIDGMVDE